ncbi:unnamed protein product [Cladocopium goreaui]|uniref:Gem-associated protein 5 TPR domain-containing protein n=1 Tax=Cladocopium goreaui TaxID=2562237 RepID=A0A9P1BLS6_9DINO|nr:unnamed protein product [Cladocopium goreaui]
MSGITESIFTNFQPFADRWLEMEVQHKQQAEDPHRARLLQLWAPELFDDVPPPEMPLVSAQWLWAALSNDPKTALAEMVAAKSESIHHRAAAALVLGRLEDAVGLYLTNELLAEALLLARLRLPSRHPLVLHIYRSWAQDFRRRGRQDQAALCFFATKEFGNALSNLEDWLAVPRAVLGPDPLRLSGAFAAAKAAAQLAGVKADGIQDGAGSQEDGSEDDCDATLAFDHRSWWGRPELRAAVQAWKRCMVEALYTGDSSSALKVARVGPLKRDLSHGERFLRGAFAGYASAMAWWMQLRKEGEWPKAECPLAAFVETGSSCLEDDDVDWDFEWRALTWLPAYSSSEEDCLLTAAVELGRSCASLASGGRNAEAPWTHLLKAINALVKGATSALQTLPANEIASPATAEGLLQVATPLERLVELLRSASDPSARDLCVAAVTDLVLKKLKVAAGRQDGERQVEESDIGQTIGCVLFGQKSHISELFRVARAYARLHADTSETESESLEELRELVPKLPLELVPDAWVVSEQLQQAVLGAATSCGLQGVANEVLNDYNEDSSPSAMISKCLGRLSAYHRSCGVPGLVPLAISGWCSQWLSSNQSAIKMQDLPEYDLDDEEQMEGPPAITSELLAKVAELLPSCWGDEVAVPAELLDLDAFEHLKWRSRLTLLAAQEPHADVVATWSAWIALENEDE